MMNSLDSWIFSLPPLSLFKEWSPRPGGTSVNDGSNNTSEGLNFVTLLDDLTTFAYELCTTRGKEYLKTRRMGRRILTGLSIASGKLCIILRLMQALAHEGDLPLPVDEQLAIQKLLQRISIYQAQNHGYCQKQEQMSLEALRHGAIIYDLEISYN